MQKIKSICVYCGSSTGIHPRYANDAALLGKLFVQHEIRLVNGGGRIGLMGIMADAVMQSGGLATGVIPISLKEKEIAHTGMTELIVVADMHTRKLTMVNMSDAFMALPGGFGTMDEVFETLTWSQLHLHSKPIVLYNPNGFYDAILKQADHMLDEGFLNETSRRLLMSTDKLDQLLPMLMQYKHSAEDKWSRSEKV